MVDKRFENILKGELLSYLEDLIYTQTISLVRPGKPGMTASLFNGLRVRASIKTLSERYESRVRENAERETQGEFSGLLYRHR